MPIYLGRFDSDGDWYLARGDVRHALDAADWTVIMHVSRITALA